MPVANFDALCAGLCEFTGAALSEFPPDEHGNRALTWQWEHVRHVTVLQLAARPSDVVLLCYMGAVPDTDAEEAWTALLDANMQSRGSCAPRFAREPLGGDATVLWPCRLADIDLADAISRLDQIVRIARDWSRDPLARPQLEDGRGQCGQRMPWPDGVPAVSANFRALRGQLDAAGGDEEEASSFVACVGGIDVLVEHVTSDGTDQARMSIGLDHLLPAHDRLDYLMSLMDANYALGLQPGAPVACRNPDTQAVLLTCVHPLAGDDGPRCLDTLNKLAALMLDWNASLALEGQQTQGVH